MKNKPCTYSRRAFLRIGMGVAAGAPLALSVGCGGGTVENPHRNPPVYRADAKVAIVSCQTYGSEVMTALQQALDLLGGVHTLVNGKTITLKVNLTCAGYFENQLPP